MDKLEDLVLEVRDLAKENNIDLQYHIKRTDLLEQLTTPIYKDYIERKSIEDFKKKQREELVYKLKLPGLIISVIAAMGLVLTWLMGK